MLTERSVAVRTNPISTIVWIGFILFAVSFFLPALGPRTSILYGGGWTYTGDGTAVPGWWCAWMALLTVGLRETYSSLQFLALLSGLINPLVLLFLVCGMIRKLEPARAYLAVTILAFVIATWIYLAHTAMLVAYAIWLVGIMLMLAPELVTWRIGSQRMA